MYTVRGSVVHTDAVIRTLAADEAAGFTLPRHLLTTDRVLQRWAVSVGYGLPTEDWDDQPRPKPAPLPDDVAIVVDQCILQSPPKTQKLITRWYKTPQPVEAIARELGMSPRNVYKARGICLEFMRGRMLGAGNAQLVRMLEAIEG